MKIQLVRDPLAMTLCFYRSNRFQLPLSLSFVSETRIFASFTSDAVAMVTKMCFE